MPFTSGNYQLVSPAWFLTGNAGTTPSAYANLAAQTNNFIGTLDNQALRFYTNANHINAKTDLQLYTAVPTGNIVTAVSDILHIRRGGQSGANFPQAMSIALGKWFADTNGRTRADFRLVNGAVNVPDFTPLSLFSQGGVGINGNGTNADWVWGVGGGIGRGNGGALLALMGANASNNLGPHIGAWTNSDTYPLFFQLNWSHNNVGMLFDGYYDGSFRSAHAASRAYGVYKNSDALNFYGQTNLAAAGTAWVQDLMGRWRYAGATLAGGELDFNNVVKNRRIVLHDSNAASDHTFYGFGINAATLRYQVPNNATSHVFYYATAVAASQEIGRLNAGGFALQIGNGFKPGGGAWGAVSDKRIKKDIQPFTKGLDEVLQLEPVSFQYNGKVGSVDDGKTYTSLIAQDAKKVIPEFVEEQDISDEVYNEMSKGDQKLFKDKKILVLSSGMTDLEGLLINAVKELAAENKRLNERLTALEAKQ